MKPYGLMADVHFHNWSAFSNVSERGVNSRLESLIKEVYRCAKEVKSAGGDTLVIAGDIFHVRGSVAPSVLNPVTDCFRELKHEGIEVFMLAGNHDLEGKGSNRVSSAITALEDSCTVISEHGSTVIDANTILIPWFEDLAELKEELVLLSETPYARSQDVVIHAPIDGVIKGLPNSGLDPEWLGNLGFKRVFAGHYHNHIAFPCQVYSIGALAHHTWSDVGHKAGFLIVSEYDVKWFKSHLPEFIDIIPAEMSESDVELLVEGNYARAKLSSSKVSDVNDMRAWLTGSGAVGVIIQSVKEAVTERDGSVSKSYSSGATLEVSISEYVRSLSIPHSDLVLDGCQKILAEAGV